MSTDWSNKLPEVPAHPNADERFAINRTIEGNLDSHGEVSLTTATALTVVTTTFNSSTGCIILVPMNAQARTEHLAGTAYVSAVNDGSFSITHPSSSAARVFRFTWIG